MNKDKWNATNYILSENIKSNIDEKLFELLFI